MGILDRLLSKASVEERFWNWFAINSTRLMAVKTGSEPVCNELHRELKKVKQELVFLFGPIVDGRREFIVSADGIRSAFPAVQTLVGAAPDIPAWKIIAFRPASGVFGKLQYKGRDFTPDDFWFSAHLGTGRNGPGIGLVIYGRGLSQAQGDPVVGAAFIMLDHALGEYVVETTLGALEFEPLPMDPAGLGLRPFQELPAAVEELSRRLAGE